VNLVNYRKYAENPAFRDDQIIFWPIADSESITTLNFEHSAIRKHVSLAMGLFRIGIKYFLLRASRPPPSTTSGIVLYEPDTLPSIPWLSVRECPNFLKILAGN
jgi:hypothetical protein